MPQNDLQNDHDVQLLVDTFYTKVRQNSDIGYIFNDIAQLDWDIHLPKIYTFWQSVLFHSNIYKGNVMLQHILLNKKVQLQDHHFETWLRLWQSTVDELFEGEIAASAKQKADAMQWLMRYKIRESEKSHFIQ